jgi:hypothetical protein
MAISVQCPGCEKRLKTRDELAGKRVKCPGCGQSVLVPAAHPGVASPAREEPPPAPKGGTPVRWLLRLGLSAIAALILGAVGFGVADAGFERQTSVQIEYSPSGIESKQTGNGRLRFYGVELLKSDDIDAFRDESNRIALMIVATMVSAGGVCGGGLAFLALRRLTRS